VILPSPFGWISAKQSPPMPVDWGFVAAEPRAGGDRSVSGRAALAHHLDRRKRRLRVRCCDHRVLSMDRGAAGEVEIPHNGELA
jgi:hypothetical protein